MKSNTLLFGQMFTESLQLDTFRALVAIVDSELANPTVLNLPPECDDLPPEVLRMLLIGMWVLTTVEGKGDE